MIAIRAGAWRGRGGVAAAVWLAAVAAIAILRSTDGWPRVAALASSPEDVVTGRLWSLLTSGLIVTQPAGVQIAAAALLVAAAVPLLGGGGFWLAATAGHVGSALIAYAGIGVLWLVARPDVDTTVGNLDYGISCVVAGAAGALTAVVLRDRPRRLGVAAVAVVSTGLAALPPVGLASVEHGLAFGLGAAVTARITLPRTRFPSRPASGMVQPRDGLCEMGS